MATLKYSIPGIGGSLGTCVICGDNFAAEMILGKSVKTISVAGMDKDSLPVHEKCAEKVVELSGPWTDIRDKFPEGPMKRFFDEESAERDAQDLTHRG